MQRGEYILLAVSGGCDSMAMLRLFTLIQHSWRLKLSIGHVNHELRGADSDADEQLVRETAESQGFPFFVRRLGLGNDSHIPRGSPETEARGRRYEALEVMRTEAGAVRIATAHHADDNAETVLMNLVRGAGIRGMAGIPVSRDNGNVIRPLLFSRREELRRFAAAEGLRFREDATNASLDYTRNVYRHRILPALGAVSDSDPVEGLMRLSATMAGLRERIDQEIVDRLKIVVGRTGEEDVELKLPLFRAEPEYLRPELLLAVFRELGIEESERKIAAVLQLADRATGRRLDIGNGITVAHDRDKLLFRRAAEALPLREAIEVGKSYDLGTFQFSSRIVQAEDVEFRSTRDRAFVDADRLSSRLLLRSWSAGDAFIPLGLHHRKKLSDFFGSEKVPDYRKNAIPLLESDGTIVWVCGMRIDDRFKVTSSTRSFVELVYTPRTEGMA